jgi:hypothetical protein
VNVRAESVPDRASGALRARLAGALARRIVWLTDARRNLRGEATAEAALITILGREHYGERRKRYPVAGWRDLRRVLAQELGPDSTTLTFIGPLVDDQREVTFYELRPGMTARTGRTLWLLPESLVLARALAPGTAAVVARDGFRYCLEPGGQSHPFAGPIASPALFLLAVGLDGTTPVIEWSADAARAALPGALAKLAPGAWLGGLQRSSIGSFAIAWRPLAMLAAVALVGYLALASLYLTVTAAAREHALAGLGAEVETLLRMEHEVTRSGEQQAAIAALLNARGPSLDLWKVVAAAWSRGAALADIHFVDGELTLRGNAPSATDLLGTLALIQGVRDAKFVAPVRHDQPGREEFAISLTLIPESERG